MRSLFACCVLILLAGPARAEDARAMFERATAEYKAGNYAAAAAGYEALFQLTKDPVLLYNIGQAHRRAGNLTQAIDAYNNFLSQMPKAKNAEDVKKRIAELEVLREIDKKYEQPEKKPEPVVEKPPPVVEKKPAKKDDPVYKKWWLWTIVGGVVVVGVAVGVAVALTTGGGEKFGTNLPDVGPAALRVDF